MLLSKLGLGCWSIGSDSYWGNQDHKDSVRTIQAAYRGGIRHFDTARAYSGGRSEQITGQQLKKVRGNVVLTTKSTWLPAESVPRYLEISLRRLCTDSVDIFYIHWPNPRKDFGPMMEALEKERNAGRIRYIGVSNFSIREMENLKNSGNIDYCQTGYSLLWRFPEQDLIPWCIDSGIRIITYSSLAQGLLTGSGQGIRSFGKDDPRRKLAFLTGGNKKPVSEFLSDFTELCGVSGYTPAQLSLNRLLRLPWTDTVLAGARNRKQVEENISAASVSPAEDILGEIDKMSLLLMSRMDRYDNIFRHTP